MRRIEKGPEAPCLSVVRREAARLQGATGKALQAEDWAIVTTEQKQELRDCLLRDQGNLCAYCCDRVTRDAYDETHPTGTKIEHFEARTISPARMFEWDNLLGVCGGRRQWAGRTIRTCDEARGARMLNIRPTGLNPHPEQCFQPTRTGALQAKGSLAALDLETLNLDHEMLRHNRQEVITRLQTLLRKDDSARRIRELLAVATTPPFPPYAFVASWYLRLKLRAREESG